MCPEFSLFTTCYNSYDKIIRAYNSIKTQTLLDWEWVILDDSPNDEHFPFLKKALSHDKRIRLYKRSENNGNIGNVKNEAVSLCRGNYLLEMDHDDEIFCVERIPIIKVHEMIISGEIYISLHISLASNYLLSTNFKNREDNGK
jgi:glycosyltransferase involved in cell wall biosynthesis